MAIEEARPAGTPTGTRRAEPSNATLAMVENLPTTRPDLYNKTVARFGGNVGRAKVWLGLYLQFYMNMIKDMIENASKTSSR